MFRHDLDKHSICFRACAVLTQLSLSMGSKQLFSIENEYVDLGVESTENEE
jgi:hypothetical protein